MVFGPTINPKRSVTTHVYPAAIQSMFVPGGDIHGFAGKVQRNVRTQTRRAAPRRTGALARSIQGDRIGTNQFGNRFSVYSYLPHARWVSEGTAGMGAGYIYGSPVGSHMRLSPAYAGHPVNYQPVVHGQRPNPFMSVGLARGLAISGLL